MLRQASIADDARGLLPMPPPPSACPISIHAPSLLAPGAPLGRRGTSVCPPAYLVDPSSAWTLDLASLARAGRYLKPTFRSGPEPAQLRYPLRIRREYSKLPSPRPSLYSCVHVHRLSLSRARTHTHTHTHSLTYTLAGWRHMHTPTPTHVRTTHRHTRAPLDDPPYR